MLGAWAWYDISERVQCNSPTAVDVDEVTSVESNEASQVVLGDVARLCGDGQCNSHYYCRCDEVTSVESNEASQVVLGDVAWYDYVAMDDAIHTTAVDDDEVTSVESNEASQVVLGDVVRLCGDGQCNSHYYCRCRRGDISRV